MAQTSRFWNGLTGGDATVAPYDADTEFAKVLNDLGLAGASGRIVSGDNQAKGGVFRGVTDDAGTTVLGQLKVTTSGSSAFIASGRAMVAGTWYENSASASFAISTPSGATRIDRVVLRKDWTAKTVRLNLLTGSEGGAAPALTRSWGATWEIALASVSITTGGVITIDDERPFLGSGIIYADTLLADAATIDIAGIPAVYDSLEITLRARTDNVLLASNGWLRVNNSSASVYDMIYREYDDGIPAADSFAYAQNKGYVGLFAHNGMTAGVYSDTTIRIQNYADATMSVTWRAQAGIVDGANTNSYIGDIYGGFRTLGAVTRLTFLLDGVEKFKAGTTISVRGIPAP